MGPSWLASGRMQRLAVGLRCSLPPCPDAPCLPATHRWRPGPRLQSVPRGEVLARRAEAGRVAKKKRELHSQRCDTECKLAIAR